MQTSLGSTAAQDDTGQRNTAPHKQIYVNHNVTAQQVKDTICKLPDRRAPGPDEIPNEILKVLSEPIAAGLAKAASSHLERGALPKGIKNIITVAMVT